MTDWDRRSILAAGAALPLGSGLASIGMGKSGSAVNGLDDLPDPSLQPNPEMDEDWPSYLGDAGHARYVKDGPEIDGDALEVAWSVDYGESYSVAIADETVYVTTDAGVEARDAADGALVWKNSNVDAGGPSVVGDTVYLSGEPVVALDRSDGSVRWKYDFGSGAGTTVAYDGVYSVVDGTLYALEAADGSLRWKKESVMVTPYDSDEPEEYEFCTTTAAANGVVYAGTPGGLLAFEPETGDDVWKNGRPIYDGSGISATETAVLAKVSQIETEIYDAQTGDFLNGTGWQAPALGEEIYVSGWDTGINGGSIKMDGEYDWTIDKPHLYGHGVISGETVYSYFTRDGGPPNAEYDEALVALNKYDGSEKWVLSKDDIPVGHIDAISGETIYVDHNREGKLVALRESTDDRTGSDGEDTDQDATDDDNGAGGGDNSDSGAGGGDNSDSGAGGGDNSDRETGGSDGTADENDSGVGGSDDTDTESETGGSDGTADDNETGGDDAPTGDGTGTGNEPTDAEDDTKSDDVPGFTTGAGIAGGALGLEWLRRRVDSDEPAE
ncbi:PQQ-binding-like beta-propeller repeat protein [Natrinema halophilum]|uniref:PQQ-binding-like beta-propeller repeat protein n=1 Tax=Natrinema halophilum TaxID=1699371 RepID=A0A7D5KSS6_9EURY|nr:PQQ-binding-like beta-propeller repeat protein [Natrinema halophilum]QLG49724.1 PQQ-binding-like beta-propeller repeat protein [Natrinema halophilum]